MFDSLVSAFKNLKRKSGRSFLTVLGITIGVGSVILIGNISQCGSSAISEELDGLGMGSIAISANVKSASTVNLSSSELNIIKNFKHVVEASPVIMKSSQVSNSRRKEDAVLWGVDSHSNKIISINPVYGRCISERDVKSGENVCMVDQSFAKEIYGRENIINKKLLIAVDGVSDEYSIIGIIKTGSGMLDNILGEYIHTFIYVPYTTLQNYTGRESFDQIIAKIDDTENIESVGKSITKKLNINSGIENAYYSNSLVKQKEGLTSILNIVTLILSAVGIVSLFVASLSIMNIMLVSVNERTREIGIKKSIGAKNKTIMFEFLIEAMMLTFSGAALGLLSGTIISVVGTAFLKIKFHSRLDITITTILFSMLSGIIFGIYPAYKASKLNPVDALRTE